MKKKYINAQIDFLEVSFKDVITLSVSQNAAADDDALGIDEMFK